MTRWIKRSDAVLATVFTALGALLLFGGFAFPFGPSVVAVGLLVVAVVMFLDVLRAPLWVAATLAGVALVMLVAEPLGRFLGGFLADLLTVAAGAALLVLGILKLTGDGWDTLVPGRRTSGAADA